jgi:hypothetical protein
MSTLEKSYRALLPLATPAENGGQPESVCGGMARRNKIARTATAFL